MPRKKAKCGDDEVVAAEFSQRLSITVDVDNYGDCPVRVRFYQRVYDRWGDPQDFGAYSRKVDDGKKRKVNRDGVNYVTISCDKSDDEDCTACRFKYSIEAE